MKKEPEVEGDLSEEEEEDDDDCNEICKKCCQPFVAGKGGYIGGGSFCNGCDSWFHDLCLNPNNSEKIAEFIRGPNLEFIQLKCQNCLQLEIVMKEKKSSEVIDDKQPALSQDPVSITDLCATKSSGGDQICRLEKQLFEITAVCKKLQADFSDFKSSNTVPIACVNDKPAVLDISGSPSLSPKSKNSVGNTPKSFRATAPSLIRQNFHPNSHQKIFTFFAGPHHPLSNLFKAPILMHNSWFCANEQYIQFRKAQIYGDPVAQEKILIEKDTHAIRLLGKEVRGYKENKELWLRNAPGIVYEANLAKYKNHLNLRTILLATKDNFLAEATPDDFWGIGVKGAEKFDPKKWVGKNVAARILTDVRSKISELFQAEVNTMENTVTAATTEDQHADESSDKTEKDVIVIGDSHVARVSSFHVGGSGLSFKGLAGAKLANVTDFVYNRGKNLPKKVGLLVGSNDLSSGTCPELCAANYGYLLKTLQAQKVDTTVFGIPLVTDFNANQTIKFANKALAAICNIFGARFVSTSPLFHEGT